jgi:hypothetical protein
LLHNLKRDVLARVVDGVISDRASPRGDHNRAILAARWDVPRVTSPVRDCH